jgi:hypothetical protein
MWVTLSHIRTSGLPGMLRTAPVKLLSCNITKLSKDPDYYILALPSPSGRCG